MLAPIIQGVGIIAVAIWALVFLGIPRGIFSALFAIGVFELYLVWRWRND